MYVATLCEPINNANMATSDGEYEEYGVSQG